MNSYITIVLVVCGCVAISTAQFENFGGGFSDGYFETSFGAPSYGGLSAVGSRDPRANRGPVLFPPSPPNGPPQTSGVVPGASGYGFVPPGSQGGLPEVAALFVNIKRDLPIFGSIDIFFPPIGPAVPRYYYHRGFYL